MHAYQMRGFEKCYAYCIETKIWRAACAYYAYKKMGQTQRGKNVEEEEE